MKVLYGTTNQAKLAAMKHLAEPLGMEVISLKDVTSPIPAVEENGKTLLENATIKAKAYYNAFDMPVFSCDSGLYFDELEEAQQPGTHVRRVNGKELNDEEMIAYYGGLAKEHGGRITGRYRNAICFIVEEERMFTDDSIYTDPFYLTETPHAKRNPGFPLDSLSIDPGTGKYYYDIEDASVAASAVDVGLKRFFEETIKHLRKV